MAQAHRGLRRHVKETTYLINFDQGLSALSGRWAQFRPRRAAPRPTSFTIPTPAARSTTRSRRQRQRPHARQAMPIEAGATYVFDLGYYDYAWWGELDGAAAGSSPR